MKNFKNLLIYEFLDKLISVKFFLILAVSLVITCIFLTLKISDYKRDKDEYEVLTSNFENKLNEFRCYSELKIPLYVKPNIFSIFNNGDEPLGNIIEISYKDRPQFHSSSSEGNVYMKYFSKLDLIGIIELLFSFLAIFLVSESIANDRENGMLKLIFSNTVSIKEYFFSRYIANILTLSIPVVLLLLLTYLVLIIVPFVSIEELSSGKFLQIFLVIELYLSFYVFVFLLLSLNSSNVSKSLIKCLFTYVVISIILPGIISSLVDYYYEPPKSDLVGQQMANEYREFNKKVEEFEKKNKPSNIQIDFYMGFDEIGFLLGITRKDIYYYYKDKVQFMISHWNDLQHKNISILANFRNKVIQPTKTKNNFLIISPNNMLNSSTKKICNTHYTSYEKFEYAAGVYKLQIIDYMKQKKGFGFSFFTQMEEENFRDKIEEYPDEYFDLYSYDNYPKLDLNDMPRFSYKDKIFFPYEILLLLITNIILCLLCFTRLKSLKY